MQKIIAIVGPTAAGKTAASIDLAEAVGGEVVSADSRQVYRGLDIGTGKATLEEMRGVPHHLIDVADPGSVFSAAQYREAARAAITDIAARGRVPIVVGGTGFYIDALIGAVPLPDVPPDAAFRIRCSVLSLEELQRELKDIDPERYETIDRKNRVRLIRALEVARSSSPKPERWPLSTGPYSVLWIGLTLPREELEKKIHARLIDRLGLGMLEEAERLHAGGLSFERMEELGLEYRYMSRYLKGALSREAMITELESEIRKYAKRQMTWFKRNTSIRWFRPGQGEQLIREAEEFLAR